MDYRYLLVEHGIKSLIKLFRSPEEVREYLTKEFRLANSQKPVSKDDFMRDVETFTIEEPRVREVVKSFEAKGYTNNLL